MCIRTIVFMLILWTLACPAASDAAVPLADTVAGTLAVSGSYRVTSDLVIPPGKKLVIGAGARLVMGNGRAISVLGSLFCSAAADSPIVFTSESDSSHAGSWKGILLDGPEASGLFRHCRIAGAENGIYLQSARDGVVESCRITGSRQAGIYCIGGIRPQLSGNRISGGLYGIVCYEEAAPVIQGNTIMETGQAGIYCFNGSSPEIDENTVIRSRGPGIYCLDASDPLIRGNLIAENRTGISCMRSSPVVMSNTIRDNTGDGITCLQARVLITYNNIFNNRGYQLAVRGSDSLYADENWWGNHAAIAGALPDTGSAGRRRKLTGLVSARSILLTPLVLSREQPRDLADLELLEAGSEKPADDIVIGSEVLFRTTGTDRNGDIMDYATVHITHPGLREKHFSVLMKETGTATGIYEAGVIIDSAVWDRRRLQATDLGQSVSIMAETGTTFVRQRAIRNLQPEVLHLSLLNDNASGKISVREPVGFAWEYSDPDYLAQPQSEWQAQLAIESLFTENSLLETGGGQDSLWWFYLSSAKLKGGYYYHLRVRVRDFEKWSNWQQLRFATNAAPSVPEPFHPVDGTTLHEGLWPDLAVMHVPDPDGDTLIYRFQLFTMPDSLVPSASGSTAADGEYAIWRSPEQLAENGMYAWRVCTWDGTDSSGWTPLQRITVNMVDEPVQPFGLIDRPVPDSTGACRLSWEAAVDPDPGGKVIYELHLSRTEKFTDPVVIKNLSGTSYVIREDLENKQKYYWKVRAVSGDREEWSSYPGVLTFTWRTPR